MNILITGANGQLGNEMQVLSKENRQHTYFFTDVQELDICDEQAVHGFVEDNRIDVIVNCAAYTAVDTAEDNQELCDKLNHVAPGYLASTEPDTPPIRKRRLLALIRYMALLNWRVSRR